MGGMRTKVTVIQIDEDFRQQYCTFVPIVLGEIFRWSGGCHSPINELMGTRYFYRFLEKTGDIEAHTYPHKHT